MATRAAGAAIGVVFGVMLCWTGMASPDVIRGALLFEQSYLFLFMGAAVLTATAGVWLLRRRRVHALLAGEPVHWTPERPGRRHVVGSVLFGLGWGLADACPGPIAAQLGMGIPWAPVIAVGTVIGVAAYLSAGARETEPASDAEAPPESSSLVPRAAAT
ncbi:MAG: uncharacterized protein QOG68_2050 [Solirubrobacteraceae bacterium]|nr:uncharacterized protein [Solirubrobacteraceae bacterium]